MLIPERAQWNGGVCKGQRCIFIFIDGSKLGGSTGAEVFCRELCLELNFRLNNDYSVFQSDIFAILRAIKAISGGHALNSESYVNFVDSQDALRMPSP